MAFGTLPDHVRHQRFAAGAFPRRLRAWRERNNLSQSEAALKLQISKRTLLEPDRAISSLDQRENRFLSTPSADAFAHWNVVRFAADSMDCRSFQQTGGCG